MPIRLPRKTTRSLEHMLRLASEAPGLQESSVATPSISGADPGPTPPLLSLKEAADWLSVSLSTLNRMIARGDLTAIRVGARRKVPASYLEAYLAKDIITPNQVIDIVQSLSEPSEHIQNTER